MATARAVSIEAFDRLQAAFRIRLARWQLSGSPIFTGDQLVSIFTDSFPAASFISKDKWRRARRRLLPTFLCNYCDEPATHGLLKRVDTKKVVCRKCLVAILRGEIIPATTYSPHRMVINSQRKTAPRHTDHDDDIQPSQENAIRDLEECRSY